MRCTIEYQYSCQYSYEYLSTCPQVQVQVRVLLLCNSRVRVQYEYQKFSTRVLRVPSTSTPALSGSVITRPSISLCAKLININIFQLLICSIVITNQMRFCIRNHVFFLYCPTRLHLVSKDIFTHCFLHWILTCYSIQLIMQVHIYVYPNRG